MALVVVLFLVSLPPLDAANVTTLEDIFLQKINLSVREFMINLTNYFGDVLNSKEDTNSISLVPYTKEIAEYLEAIELQIFDEFTRALADIPVESIYDDLNVHCSQYQKRAIKALSEKPRNNSCVQIRLRKMMASKLKMAVEVGLQQVLRECIKEELPFCTVANRNCILAHEERTRQLLISYIEDWNIKESKGYETHLDVIVYFLYTDLVFVFPRIIQDIRTLPNIRFLNISIWSNTPLKVENVLRIGSKSAIRESVTQIRKKPLSKDESIWGVIKSNTGNLDLPCFYFRNNYSRMSEETSELPTLCFYDSQLQSNVDLVRCVFTNPTSPPLKWLPVPPVCFHSHCLCLAFKGKGCGVTAPQGEDPRVYCLSVLLRDFQRQVTYRPALTYLDYASQTRVPVCQFSTFILLAFHNVCDNDQNTSLTLNINIVPLIQCYFKDVVNKHLNCSKTLLIDNFNRSVLCNLMQFMQLVLCDDETDDDVRVPFYGAGDSTLVLALTYVDVAVRVLTLVTYLVCPQLRNLPGKLLICYQVTALLRLLVVRATLEDLPMAVRLDVAMDLSSTLWLTSYLHFLTVSIEALRLPDSLSPKEVRMVLLRYVLLGWALPTALSATFFCMDEALDSHVQFGQIFFVLCYYAALFSNLYMLFKNFHFYYDVKSNARILQKGGKARSVFAGLIKFALKTSVLSGGGITLRLIFTQFQGLEDLLGYYHALGTLQGLLLFFLYGCNREARVFWISVFRSTSSHCRRRHNPSAS